MFIMNLMMNYDDLNESFPSHTYEKHCGALFIQNNLR